MPTTSENPRIKEYEGVLTADFYSSYNKLQARAKQRCLVHLLREIKEVEEKDKLAPDSIDAQFCEELKTVFKQTIDVWSKVPHSLLWGIQRRFL